MTLFLIILSSLLLVWLIVSTIAIARLAKIIFLFEDDIANFSNLLIDINERIQQVQRIRALMSHPAAATYIAESFEDLRYCGFLLGGMIRKSKMLLKKDYTELEIVEEGFPQLHQRLEQAGVYDPEEDGEINVMSDKEASEIGQRALRIRNEVEKKQYKNK